MKAQTTKHNILTFLTHIILAIGGVDCLDLTWLMTYDPYVFTILYRQSINDSVYGIYVRGPCIYPPQASNRLLFLGTNILIVLGLLVLLWSNLSSFLILELIDCCLIL